MSIAALLSAPARMSADNSPEQRSRRLTGRLLRLTRPLRRCSRTCAQRPAPPPVAARCRLPPAAAAAVLANAAASTERRVAAMPWTPASHGGTALVLSSWQCLRSQHRHVLCRQLPSSMRRPSLPQGPFTFGAEQPVAAAPAQLQRYSSLPSPERRKAPVQRQADAGHGGASGGKDSDGSDWEDAGRWLEPAAPGATAALRSALAALAAGTAAEQQPVAPPQFGSWIPSRHAPARLRQPAPQLHSASCLDSSRYSTRSNCSDAILVHACRSCMRFRSHHFNILQAQAPLGVKRSDGLRSSLMWGPARHLSPGRRRCLAGLAPSCILRAIKSDSADTMSSLLNAFSQHHIVVASCAGCWQSTPARSRRLQQTMLPQTLQVMLLHSMSSCHCSWLSNLTSPSWKAAVSCQIKIIVTNLLGLDRCCRSPGGGLWQRCDA